MMDGITVLSKTEIIQSYEVLYDVIGWLAAITFILLIFTMLAFLIEIEDDDSDFCVGTIFGVLTIVCFLVALITVGISFSQPGIKTGKYQYEVTIDESVSLSNFNEKYAIIEQEGLIYTIEEK